MDADYDEQEKAFYHKVDILGRWRDVQASGSLFHQQFQEEIEGITARRQHLMAIRPQLEKLDEQIAAVARRLAAVQDDSDDGGWAAVAIGAACVGAVLLGVCLLFDPGWKTWAAMVVGFAVAIGAAVISVRSREDASAECAGLRADLEDLRRQRAELLGDEN
jgi:hypothetical protein